MHLRLGVPCLNACELSTCCHRIPTPFSSLLTHQRKHKTRQRHLSIHTQNLYAKSHKDASDDKQLTTARRRHNSNF